MDALRRAEAEKKNAAARGDDLSIDLPETSGELSLEPLETSTERPLRVLGGDATAYDERAAPTRQQAARPGLAREAAETEANPFLTAPGPGSAVQPTIVTAQTVFEATRGGSVPRALVAIIVCTVLLAAGLTAVGFYAYRQTPPTHDIPSPRVAAQIERRPGAASPPSIALPATPSASPPSLPPLPVTAANEPPASPPPAVTATAPAATALPPPAVASIPAAAAPAAPIPQTVTAPVARTLAAEIPRDAEIAGGEVRIAKRRTGGALADDVTRAYGAFQLGKLDLAADLYRRALARDPGRVDALLGLGAIAMRERRPADAHRYYREVLAISPRHPVASAALFMLEGGEHDDASEARLKLLADREADSPYLRFALGNLYAEQRRWSDAQDAYFAAYSRAPTNADYAYNLAVSLDQLGQRKAALDYYRKALALRAQGAAFDASRAHARVAALLGAP